MTFNMFNTNLKYDLMSLFCFVFFMFTFSYFIIINIYLNFGLANLVFLVLTFVFVIGTKTTKINNKRITLNLNPKHEIKGPRQKHKG
jgi:hypothetical protein